MDTVLQQQRAAAVQEAAAPTMLGVSQDQPMALKVTALQQRYAALTQVKAQVLKSGVDYGSVGEANKDVLMQPGAQKLAILFGLHARFEFVEKVEDWTGADHGGEPFFRYLVKCVLTDDSGAFVGESFGETNSWDTKYRWRWVQDHKMPLDVRKDNLRRRVESIEEFKWAIDRGETTGKWGKPDAYWQAFRDAIANGTAISGTKEMPDKRTGGKKTETTYRIETITYRLPNDDIFSQVNTLAKMAQKRALVGAILIATGASEFFTQDLDDMSDESLDNMGVRRASRPVGDADPDTAPPATTRQGRDVGPLEPPAKPKGATPANGNGAIDWNRAPAAGMIPQIKRLTGINDVPALIQALKAHAEITLQMSAEQIAAIIKGQSTAPAAPPEPPGEAPFDAGLPTEPEPDDLPF